FSWWARRAARPSSSAWPRSSSRRGHGPAAAPSSANAEMGKLRVGGGEARGRRLKAPKGIRPTQGIVKAAIFNLVGPGIEGAHVLDLFAGSGAIGIEALSRGAAQVTFVDRAPLRRHHAHPSSRMTNKTAVYPGSFDPFTNGHLDVVERALGIFDHLIVAVAANPDKRQPLFSVDERVRLIKDALKRHDRVEVASYTGLTVEYARSKGGSTLVKGLRACSDLDGEMQ